MGLSQDILLVHVFIVYPRKTAVVLSLVMETIYMHCDEVLA